MWHPTNGRVHDCVEVVVYLNVKAICYLRWSGSRSDWLRYRDAIQESNNDTNEVRCAGQSEVLCRCDRLTNPADKHASEDRL